MLMTVSEMIIYSSFLCAKIKEKTVCGWRVCPKHVSADLCASLYMKRNTERGLLFAQITFVPSFIHTGEIRAQFSQLENQKRVPVFALRMKTKPGRALKLSWRKSYTYISVRSLFLSVIYELHSAPVCTCLMVVSPTFSFRSCLKACGSSFGPGRVVLGCRIKTWWSWSGRGPETQTSRFSRDNRFGLDRELDFQVLAEAAT